MKMNIDYNGMNLTLQQTAYILDEYHYTAHGVNDIGEDYMVYWVIENAEAANQDEACNWDEFWVEKL